MSFWSGLGGELAKQWATRILTPALAFWLGGLAAVWWHAHADGVDARGWTEELKRSARALEELPPVAQALLLVAVLMVVAVSALAAERLTLPLLRLLEGYWPWWLRGRAPSWRRRRRARYKQRRDELSRLELRGQLDIREHIELGRLEASAAPDPDRLEALRTKRAGGFSPRQAAELARARDVLHNTPERVGLAMPTRLGDVLRAAERRPREKYGLDAIVTWTALWLVMPADARTEIVQTRTHLDASLRMWLWGAAFLVWTPWTLWAFPIAVAVSAMAYYGGILGAAKLFGDLVVTAYDLYRMRLYDGLHLPRPASPANERVAGARVTNLLYGGLNDRSIEYVQPPAA